MIESTGVPVALSVWKQQYDAPALLFHPGTMTSPLQYLLLLQAFWKCGFHTIGLHHLSHGSSPKKHYLFTFDDLLQNGLDAESWIRNNLSKTIIVTGHSQGGILTLAHAGTSQHLSAAFSLCALLPQEAEAISVTRFAAFAAQRERILKILSVCNTCIPWLPVTIPNYLSLSKVFHGAHSILMLRNKMRFTYPLRYIYSLFSAKLPTRLFCPYELMTAENDALFTPELSQKVFAALEAPTKKLTFLSGGGHMAPISRHYCENIAHHITASCAGLGIPIRMGI